MEIDLSNEIMIFYCVNITPDMHIISKSNDTLKFHDWIPSSFILSFRIESINVSNKQAKPVTFVYGVSHVFHVS